MLLYLFATVSGHASLLREGNRRLFETLADLLSRHGFSPSSSGTLSISFKLLWLLGICGLSWVQVFGFFVIYVPFSPLLLFFPKRRKEYKEARRKALADANLRNNSVNSPKIGFALLVTLLTWFTLFEKTNQHGPLHLAMLLTALLFLFRVRRALDFAAPVWGARKGRIEAFKTATGNFLRKTVDDFKAGKVSEMSHLATIIGLCSWYLRIARFVSRWLYGRPAKRRAALIVLGQFISSLAILGGLSVLF